MADIAQDLANIKSAIYGEEVRGSIHDAIRDINNEVISSNTKSDNAVSTANTAAQSASNAATSATASEQAAQAAQTAAENAEARNETNVTAAEQAAQAAQTAAETARSRAETLSGSAAASATSAANSATAARQAASEARHIVYDDLSSENIPVYLADPDYMVSTAIGDLTAKINTQTISVTFTNLSFTQSGTKYVSMIQDEDLTAAMKPGYVIFNAATNISGLAIEVFDGYMVFELAEEPTTPISGEVFLHRIGDGDGSGESGGPTYQNYEISVVGESLVILDV